MKNVEFVFAVLAIPWISFTKGELIRRVAVKTPYGIVFGSRRYENHHIGEGTVTNTVDEWLGVRYGFSNRWQESRLPERSEAVFEAYEPYPSCPQIHYYQHTYVTNQVEECLVLNIYSPVTKKKQLHPVMVFIHGGSYEEGTGMRYNGFPLATHGVVVVSINYRLGELGYLTTGDDKLPGNFGLGDQILALKWISKTIEFYGGNASSVTLFGSSAGSASIGLLMTSPETEGLFHRVIMQSGSPLSFWAVQEPEVNLYGLVVDVAAAVGCTDGNIASKITCMNRTNEQTFVDMHWSVGRYSPSGLNYKPWVDGRLLPRHPRAAFTAGAFHKVPVMTGFVADEWARNAGFFLAELPDYSDGNSFAQGIDRQLFIKALHHVITRRFYWPEHLVNLVVQLYTNDQNVSDPIENRNQYVKFMSDLSMHAPIIELADILEYHNVPVYMYQFEHHSIHTPEEWWGTYHSLELDYVFGSPFTGYDLAIDDFVNYTEADRNISRVTMNLWASFAKQQVPSLPYAQSVAMTTVGTQDTFTWQPYNRYNHSYLYISTAEVSARYNFRSFYIGFWNKLLPKLLKIPDISEEYYVSNPCHEKNVVVWTLFVICVVMVAMLGLLWVAFCGTRHRYQKLRNMTERMSPKTASNGVKVQCRNNRLKEHLQASEAADV